MNHLTGRVLAGEVPSIPRTWKPIDARTERVTVREVWIRKGGTITKLQAIGRADLEVMEQWPEAQAPVVFAPTLDRFECTRVVREELAKVAL